MKKIFNIKRHLVVLDTDTLEIYALEPKTRGIDSIYVAPEDAVMQWDKDEDSVLVKKDDIIVTFYDSLLGKGYTVVTSNDWKNMLDHADEELQRRKEKWATERISDDYADKD